MGRKSTKENKNIYQISREETNLSREAAAKDLSVITLEMLSTLNTLSREKDRLIDIAADGEITDDEIPDFLEIKDHLEKMSLSIESLKLWIERTIASGKFAAVVRITNRGSFPSIR